LVVEIDGNEGKDVAIEVGLKLPFTTSNAGKPVMDANALNYWD
jgi:hypothetical protein